MIDKLEEMLKKFKEEEARKVQYPESLLKKTRWGFIKRMFFRAMDKILNKGNGS